MEKPVPAILDLIKKNFPVHLVQDFTGAVFEKIKRIGPPLDR
ncbi:MAG: hypothetical protein WD426_00340 [Anditalea sp.]